MAAPRWIFVAFLVSLSLGLCYSYRPLAADHVVQKEAEMGDKNGNFSNNDVEGVAIGTECFNEGCYEPLPPTCESCGQMEPTPYHYEPQPVAPCLPTQLPPIVINPLPPIVVPPVQAPCFECIDMEMKEQNETALVPVMEPGLVDMGSLAQVPCFECIDMEKKEQNETALVPVMEPGLVDMGSLAQVP